MSNGMTQSERRAKILEVLGDRCMTRSAIQRQVGGGQEMLYAAIMDMCREGLLEHGDSVVLANQREAQTYKASGATPGSRPRDANFHGMAPSVFEWRGNFSLRE